ncbi:unnamed protein product [Litomosoides sigmodontis]|uniref:Uncharacterized protein n=1 Tax=Litomosoides sigmodontis TaxID=42156 RepID=A0A3P6SYU7_LITSI|nr:unnamed protein product [Litomosoides sigmodontis]
MSNSTNLTLQIINASMNETAKVIIEYDNGLEKLKSKGQAPSGISTVKPNSYITHKFAARKVMMQLHEKNESAVAGLTAARIYVSSSLPVSIIECIVIADEIADCFTVLPIAMAGERYSFSVTSSSVNSDMLTAYFIPTATASQINVTTMTRDGLNRISVTSLLHRGSITYAYNSYIDGLSTVYISSSYPLMIVLSIRTHLTQISSGNFACTMLIPGYSQIAFPDHFHVHFTPLDWSGDYRTQLLLAPATENSQPFTVLAFHSNTAQLINVTPNVISDSVTSEWRYRLNDATVGYISNYVDNRLLQLYHVSHQSDTLLLDGKALEVEYVERFRNAFPHITMQKINTKNLKRGMHCLQSSGRYLLFIFGESEKMYGYVPAFNAHHPMERSELIIENNLYHKSIFGVSFVTLFPWITVREEFGDSSTTTGTTTCTTTTTLDIFNPHPYASAQVNISYHSEAKGNLIEKVYHIAPHTNRKFELNKKMMTKLYAAYSDSIYRSNHDSRITIKSSTPISVTQSSFFGSEMADSFTVLPMKMASQKYAFSLSKLTANNSHMEKNSPIFAYYGSARELSLNLTGDNPFQVIITVQRLLLTNVTASIPDRAHFDCNATMSDVQNASTHTNINKNTADDLEITGAFSIDNVHELQTPYDCTYFIFKFFLPTVPVHCVQLTGHHVVHIWRSANTSEQIVSSTEGKPSEERMRMKIKKTFKKLRNREGSAKTMGVKLSPKQLATFADTNSGMTFFCAK